MSFTVRLKRVVSEIGKAQNIQIGSVKSHEMFRFVPFAQKSLKFENFMDFKEFYFKSSRLK